MRSIYGVLTDALSLVLQYVSRLAVALVGVVRSVEVGTVHVADVSVTHICNSTTHSSHDTYEVIGRCRDCSRGKRRLTGTRSVASQYKSFWAGAYHVSGVGEVAALVAASVFNLTCT